MAFVEAVTLSTRGIALVPLALGCQVVGWRTDNFNFASQAPIERLGAQKDGVMYSMRAGEWPEAKAQLLYMLHRPRPGVKKSC